MDVWIATFHQWFGHADNSISAAQMSARGVLIMLFGILLLRLGGNRMFQRGSPLDIMLAVVIGSNLSRAITGSAPLLATLAATVVMVLVYWIIAYAAYLWDPIGWLVKGRQSCLIDNGRIHWRVMRAHAITRRELEEAMRQAGVHGLEQVKAAYLERGGTISILPKE